MRLSIKNIREKKCVCDALMLPVTLEESGLAGILGQKNARQLETLFPREFLGRKNEAILIPAPEGIKPERILFIGLGKKDEVSSEKIRQAGGKAALLARDMGMKRMALSTQLLSSLGQSPGDFIEGIFLGLYMFTKYRKESDDRKIESLTVLSKGSKSLNSTLKWVRTVSSSVYFTRDLINTPSNDMTPTHLAKAALSLKRNGLSVKIIGKGAAEKLGLGAYLSVSKGSREEPKFIVLEYRGAKGSPLVLIGKAITFDSGGISLKPAEGMEKMKYDMSGGAAVLGIIKAASELRLPVHLIGILPATENMAGGSATKPGDVVRAVNGMTIEIVNTDAEGRLVLADSIGYAMRFNPRAIIDVATLTGASSIALGYEAIAMMGNDGELMEKIKRAAESTYERVWQMPLFEEYKEYLKSDIADIKNTGGRNGSLTTSAYFLQEFTGQVPWVHLDIAGTAWTEKEKPYIPKGASGIGVRLILNLIKELL